MELINIDKVKEFASVPFLIIRILISNFIGRRKYRQETCYYGTNKQQNIRIIMPKFGATKKSTIFFFHGGGWKQGSSKTFRFVGYYFAGLGYNVIVAEYRKAPKYVYPIQVEDAASILKFGMKKIQEEGLNADNVVLVGQSAGAHLAALLAYSEILKKIGFNKASIKGIVSISGPLNFNECKNNYVNSFIDGFVLNDENRRKADPYNYLNERVCIPILCIHGDRDPSVELASAESFINKINSIKNGLGTLIIVKNGLHSNLVKLFWKKMKEHAKMMEWIERSYT